MKFTSIKISIIVLLFTACQQPPPATSVNETIPTTVFDSGLTTAVQWKIHDMSRPKPQVVEPVNQQLPTPAPKGAIVLFNGSNLLQWKSKDSSQAKWKVEKGYVEVVPGTGDIISKESFGDVFLHVEWASPNDTTKQGQDRGNSGIFFMGQYEIQILDSYQADTYADGQAGAIYGQAPPRFNACKPRGQWNAYDIAFRRPRFAENGIVISPARITVIHNGILIQDNEEYKGPSAWLKYLPYKAHADKLPITLQEHNGKVQYRNIWALPMPEHSLPAAGYSDKAITITDTALDKLIGTYERPNATAPIVVTKNKGVLYADFFWRPGPLELVPIAANEFALKETAGSVTFTVDDKGNATELIFHLGGSDMPATKQRK